MTEEEIKELINKKIGHYRATRKLLKDEHPKDKFSAGALEALISLIQEIEENDEGAKEQK